MLERKTVKSKPWQVCSNSAACYYQSYHYGRFHSKKIVAGALLQCCLLLQSHAHHYERFHGKKILASVLLQCCLLLSFSLSCNISQQTFTFSVLQHTILSTI